MDDNLFIQKRGRTSGDGKKYLLRGRKVGIKQASKQRELIVLFT